MCVKATESYYQNKIKALEAEIIALKEKLAQTYPQNGSV